MHAHAHGIPTTPLTSDTSTALLSRMLTTKPKPDLLMPNRIKQEPVDSTTLCGSSIFDTQDSVEDYSMSSRNPSPGGSIDMEDDMTD